MPQSNVYVELDYGSDIHYKDETKWPSYRSTYTKLEMDNGGHFATGDTKLDRL